MFADRVMSFQYTTPREVVLRRAEDQLFTDASIETAQFLSGQSRGTPTLNVDGYFTSYPSNSTVLLRRTANGQPAMLMYEHGLGRVIVTSIYRLCIRPLRHREEIAQ